MLALLGYNGELILCITEQDCNDMRGGRYKFVDKTSLHGRSFTSVLLAIFKTQHDIEEMIKATGHGALLKGMTSPVPEKGETTCEGCKAIVLPAALLDGKCICCWRESARVN